jgi:hypothetical protein
LYYSSVFLSSQLEQFSCVYIMQENKRGIPAHILCKKTIGVYRPTNAENKGWYAVPGLVIHQSVLRLLPRPDCTALSPIAHLFCSPPSSALSLVALGGAPLRRRSPLPDPPCLAEPVCQAMWWEIYQSGRYGMSSLRRYLPPANEFCSGLTYDWCLDLGFICVGWIHFLLFNLTILVFGSVLGLLSVSILLLYSGCTTYWWIHNAPCLVLWLSCSVLA